MAERILSEQSNSTKGSEGEKDPLEEAQKFTKQMAAKAIIDGEVEKSKASVEKAKAEAEEAKAQAEEAKVKAKRAESGEAEPGKSGFKVTGGLDMGHINLAQERKEASDELK